MSTHIPVLLHDFLEKVPAEQPFMDEFHFYADPDRGWAWQVPLLTLPHVQFLLMTF